MKKRNLIIIALLIALVMPIVIVPAFASDDNDKPNCNDGDDGNSCNNKTKIIYVDRIVYVNQTVEVPVYVDRIVYVDRVVEKIVYKDRIVEKTVYIDRIVEKIVYVDKVVETVVYVEVPIEVIKEVIKEVPVEVIKEVEIIKYCNNTVYIEVPKEVIKYIEKVLYVNRVVYVDKPFYVYITDNKKDCNPCWLLIIILTFILGLIIGALLNNRKCVCVKETKNKNTKQ